MAEIESGDAVVVVFGMVFKETPIAAIVEGGGEVDVAILQFGNHVAEHFEELGAVHVFVDLGGIACMHFVPIDAQLLPLVGEEAVVLVHRFPESLEIAASGVIVGVFLYTSRQQNGRQSEK